MRRWILGLVLAGAAGTAFALRANTTMELLAINDEVALVDYHTRACSNAQNTWLLVDLRTGLTQELVRHIEDGPPPAKSCAVVTAELAAALGRHKLDGVELDPRSCGKHDSPWWMTAQALLDPELGKTWSLDPKRPNLTKLTRARVEQTTAALAAGPWNGKRWKVETKGDHTTLAWDGKPIGKIPRLRAQGELHEASPWVAVSPDHRSVVVGDPDRSELVVYALDDAGKATRRTPTRAR